MSDLYPPTFIQAKGMKFLSQESQHFSREPTSSPLLSFLKSEYFWKVPSFIQTLLKLVHVCYALYVYFSCLIQDQ